MTISLRFKDGRDLLESFSVFIVIFGRINGILYENDAVFLFLICISFIGIISHFKGLQRQPKGYIVWLIGFLLLYIFSYFWAVDKTRTYTNFVATLGRYIIVLYLFSIMSDSEKMLKVIKIFIAAIFVNNIFITVVFGPSALIAARNAETNLVAGNANTIGMTSASAFVLLYYSKKIFEESNKRNTILTYLFLAIYIFVSGSKKSLFLLVFSFGVMYVFTHRNKFARVLVVFLCTIVIYNSLLNVPILYETIGHRIESLLKGIVSIKRMAIINTDNLMNADLNSSDRVRLYMILRGIEWIKQKPLFGYGMANYYTLYAQNASRGFYAHNNYIEIAVGMGLVGLCWYYSLYFKGIFLTLKKMKKTLVSEAIALKFSLMIFLLYFLLDFGLVSYLEIDVQLILCIAYLLPYKVQNPKKEEYKNEYY